MNRYSVAQCSLGYGNDALLCSFAADEGTRMNICQREEIIKKKKKAAFNCSFNPELVSRSHATWQKLPAGSGQMDLYPFSVTLQ